MVASAIVNLMMEYVPGGYRYHFLSLLPTGWIIRWLISQIFFILHWNMCTFIIIGCYSYDPNKSTSQISMLQALQKWRFFYTIKSLSLTYREATKIRMSATYAFWFHSKLNVNVNIINIHYVNIFKYLNVNWDIYILDSECQ